MIRWVTELARIGLAVASIAASVPMIAFAQTSEPTIESFPTETEAEEVNASPTGDDMSEETEPPARSAIPAEVEVEIQRHINELRREQMDDRDTYFDRLLAIVAIVLTSASYFGFKRFQRIVDKKSVKAVNDQVETAKGLVKTARGLVDEIKAKRHEAASLVEGINAETVADNPVKARQAVTDVFANPKASLIEKAVANALDLQQKGRNKEAIKKWRAIVGIAEGTNNVIAANAWAYIGYLIRDESKEDCISANDEAIRLKPGFVEAYVNRGNAKNSLGRPEDASADYDRAIRMKPDLVEAYRNRGAANATLNRNQDAIADYDRAIELDPDNAEAYFNRGAVNGTLNRHEAAMADSDAAIRIKPDFAGAYFNRGNTKIALGRKDEARKDFERALEMARKARDVDLRAVVEQSLRDLDDADDS